MKPYFLLIIITIIGSSCTTQKQAAFPTKYLGHAEVLISNEMTSNPTEIGATERYIILLNSKASPLIEIYDLKTGQRVAHFIHAGNGPHEALSVTHLQIDANQDDFSLCDILKNQLLGGRISEAIQDSLYMPKILYKGKADQSANYDAMKKTSKFIVASSKTGEGRLRILDTLSGTDRCFIDYPAPSNIDKRLTPDQNASLYTSFLQTNHEGNRIGLSTLLGEMIDIVSLDNGEAKPIFTYHAAYPTNIELIPVDDKVVAVATKNTVIYFPRATATNQYLYVLYSGKTMQEKNAFSGNEVYVVDWNGKNTFKISLDQEVKAIAVSPDDKTLYGISSNMDVLKFNLTTM